MHRDVGDFYQEEVSIKDLDLSVLGSEEPVGIDELVKISEESMA